MRSVVVPSGAVLRRTMYSFEVTVEIVTPNEQRTPGPTSVTPELSTGTRPASPGAAIAAPAEAHAITHPTPAASSRRWPLTRRDTCIGLPLCEPRNCRSRPDTTDAANYCLDF